MFLTLIVGLIAAAVASVVSKKKLESMSDDEIREYLGLKLAGRVGEDQLVTIQEAVVSGVRGKRPSVDNYVEDVEDAMDELDLVEEESDLPDEVRVLRAVDLSHAAFTEELENPVMTKGLTNHVQIAFSIFRLPERRGRCQYLRSFSPGGVLSGWVPDGCQMGATFRIVAL